MKRLNSIIISMMSVILIGCQDRLVVSDSSQPVVASTKAGEHTVQADKAYVFFRSEKDFADWTNIVGLDKRFAACEVPEDTLRAMTTDALVRTALNYPLNFIYNAYNDPFVAVDLIFKNSALHRELAAREDAAGVLLRRFTRTAIDKDNTDSVFNRSESSLTYPNELFLEYLLASGKVPGLETDENRRQLKAVAGRKLAERQADTATFSGLSLAPLQLLAGQPLAGSPSRSGSWIYHSPFGKSLTVDIQDEMTDYEILYLTYQYSQNYPNAIVHGMASNKYNGNGFVWIKRDPTNAAGVFSTEYAWLQSSGTNQVTNLWNSDFYEIDGVNYEAKYYSDVDHTFIPYVGSPTPHYLSKWGNGPLMEHLPSDCPYVLSETHKQDIGMRTTHVEGVSISGPSTVGVNVNQSFSLVGKVFYRLSLEWRAETYSQIGPPPTIVSFSDYSCTVRFPEVGAYKVIFEAKFNNTVLYRAVKDVVCY